MNLALPPSGLRPLLHHDHLPLRQSELLLARRLVRRDYLRQLHLLPARPVGVRLLLFLLLQIEGSSVTIVGLEFGFGSDFVKLVQNSVVNPAQIRFKLR